MARRTINLKWPAQCRDCGAALAAGTPARYYGKGKVYGIGCHEDTRRGPQAPPEDGGAVYEPDGGGHCEDFPCCGHGQGMCASERRAERRAQARKAPVQTPQIEAPAPYFGGTCPDPEAPVDFQTELLDPFGVDR